VHKGPGRTYEPSFGNLKGAEKSWRAVEDCDFPEITRGRRIDAQWRILTIHHFDGNKLNCRWWNLAALCQRDHLMVQATLRPGLPWPWPLEEWIRPYAAAWTAFASLGEDLTRAATLARMYELLLLGRSIPEPHNLAVDAIDTGDARQLLLSLIGKNVSTYSGKSNTVLRLEGENVIVATGRSPHGTLVPIAWVQEPLDRLMNVRHVDISPESLGYRSAFVAAVLLTIPGTRKGSNPPRVILDQCSLPVSNRAADG
jgi:hypothetical protein